MAGINLLPARFPVAVTTGNDVTITLDVNDALGADYTWSGKTVVAPIVGHTTVTGFTVDTSTDGTLVLSLTDAQTTALGSDAGFDAGFEWSLSVTVGTATRTWLSGPLSVYRPGRPGATNTTTGTLTVAGAAGTAVTVSGLAVVATGVAFTPTGTVAATTVQAAIAEVSGDVTDHLADTADAHDASAVSVADTGGYYTGTNVETVLAELPGKFGPLPTYWMPAPNGTDDTAAMDAVIATAQAASPYRHLIAMRAGTYKRTTALTLTVGWTRLIGAGRDQTILSYSGSSGYAIDVSTCSPSFADFTIDGTSATGSAGALRLEGNIPNTTFEQVGFKNFATTAAAVNLHGASQSSFERCYWTDNFRNLVMSDNGASTANQNTFHSCNLGNTVGSTGAAITVTNGEGNTFDDCLIQSVANITTIHITNSAGATGVGAAGNRIVGCWFEENGNSQSGSRGIYVQGASGRIIKGTVIKDNRFFQAFHDNPSRQIELAYTTATAIDGNLAHLGSPHIIVCDGGNNTDTHIGPNAFTGIVQIGPPPPMASLWLPGVSGNCPSTPDSAGLSLTGDCEFVFLAAFDDWTPASSGQIISKDSANAGERSWALSLESTGVPQFWWSPDGTTYNAISGAVPLGFTNGTFGWCKMTFDADNGAGGRTAQVYKAFYDGTATEPTEWTLIETPITATATSIFDSATTVYVGGFAGGVAGLLVGCRLARLIVRNGIGGTAVASPNFTTPGAAPFTDAQGNVWTLNGTEWSFTQRS